MIKKFESYKSLRDTNLNTGDKVIIKYRDSKHYMQSGKIINVNTSGSDNGDVRIMLDYNNELVSFYYTNIIKVEELIEVSSGEVLNVPEEDAMNLAMSSIIKYNKAKNYYFFDEEDRWQIESYAI